MEQLFELNKNAFQQWLESKPYYDIAGRGEDPEHCPIAKFLTDVFDQTFAYVSKKTFGIGLYDREPTPLWAQEFISHIQDYCDYHGEVYVVDCLEVLKEKCSEVQHPCARAA